MQFKKKGLLRISLDEFSDTVEAPPSFRANFSNMRRRVIEPAIREIEEKDGLKIQWKTKNAGRKVTGLEFTFPPEQQTALPLDQPKKKLAGNKRINKAYIEQHARPGESYEQARMRLQEEQRRSKKAA